MTIGFSHFKKFIRNLTFFGSFGIIISCGPAFRAVKYNIPDIDDYEHFTNTPVHAGEQTFELIEKCESGIKPIEDWAMGKYFHVGMEDKDFFKKTGTVAFLVVQQDSILEEYYDEGLGPTSTFTSFSLAKVYVSTLIGIAIGDGFIKGINQFASDFIPELLNDTTLKKIKISHLLQMESGIKSKESLLNPWGTTARMYYDDNLEKILRNLKAKEEPGKFFNYQNLNSQLLAIILQRATGKPVSQLLEEKIWKPMGMESDASWSLDHEGGMEKAFCCINARARDFARFGMMIGKKGMWNGKQIVPEQWVAEIFKGGPASERNQRYRFNWYTTAEHVDIYGQGLLGQYIYVNPACNLVIVRLGEGLKYKVPWFDMFRNISGLSQKPNFMELAKSEMKKFEGEYVFGLSTGGDSTNYGKSAKVKVVNKGLKIRTNMYSPFLVKPIERNAFYNDKYSRKLIFTTDTEKGRIITWNRRGYQWVLEEKIK